jgi:endonuclease/exonuclease/phosphatase family metal-dependent hydrolase
MSRSLRIATFNLENLDDRLDQESFAERLSILRPQMERLRADVLCLQEVNAKSTSKHGPRKLTALERLVEGTPYSGYERAVSLNRPKKRYSDRHNLVILSRFPMIEALQYWHDLVPPPSCPQATSGGNAASRQTVEWDRPILHVVLDVGGGRKLNVFNLHLRAPRAALVPGHKIDKNSWNDLGGWAEGFYIAAIKRSGQALEARLAVEKIFDADRSALIAIAGDFNAADQEMPVRTLMGDEEDAGNGALAHRILVPIDRGIPASERYSVVHHGRMRMLDHILASRALMGWFRKAEIHNEMLGDELVSPVKVTNSPESSHAPLLAEFEIPD